MVKCADLRMRQQVIEEMMHVQKGSKGNNEDIMPSTQQKKEEYKIDWIKNMEVNYNRQSEEEHMVPHDVQKKTNHMCLVDKEETQQLELTMIGMALEEIWNVIVCCVGAGKDKSHGIGRIQPSIKHRE